jgi:hypothetical protein
MNLQAISNGTGIVSYRIRPKFLIKDVRFRMFPPSAGSISMKGTFQKLQKC